MTERDATACKICGSPSVEVGSRQGRFLRREFQLRQCPHCFFSFVADPYTDYAQLYSDAYYRGDGADPLVDYSFELQEPDRTIRKYEWRGIYKAVSSLVTLRPECRWLDFGCGNGGLVRFCRSRSVAAVGFEEGTITTQALAAGIPMLSRADLEGLSASFDVITAIEVLEHVEAPLETFSLVRRLLKPNGLFFFTTGNAAPHRKGLSAWTYVIPEIHVSFYEPSTLRDALVRTGFHADFRGYLPGFTDIIRFKILKNLHIRTCSIWERALPWPVVARAADAYYRITAHPIGWAV